MGPYLPSKDSPDRRASGASSQLGRSTPNGDSIGMPHRRHDDYWLERWMRTCADLARLQYVHPMVDAVIDEIDGRMIRIGERWLADFASCNYLGLDLDREVIDAVPGYLEQWGTHPSWSRLLGSPVLYEQLESELTELVGAEDTLALPTITLIHMTVIPIPARSGNLF